MKDDEDFVTVFIRISKRHDPLAAAAAERLKGHRQLKKFLMKFLVELQINKIDAQPDWVDDQIISDYVAKEFALIQGDS